MLELDIFLSNGTTIRADVELGDDEDHDEALARLCSTLAANKSTWLGIGDSVVVFTGAVSAISAR